jgi:YtxH-like protein
MILKDIIEQLPRRELGQFLRSLRRPARAEFVMYGVAGALIGAGLALLFAPTRGSELRSKIGERIDEYMSAANENAANGHDRAQGA